MPLWSPQAQFAGYYVALDKGIYARHGIDLKILKAGPGHAPAQTLQDGKADFAILWLTTALQRRSAGIKLVNLAQITQRSSMMLIAKKSSGIKTVTDMQGKKVGMWGRELCLSGWRGRCGNLLFS
jgi:NitT/TauT family transport system substrate-binding protein